MRGTGSAGGLSSWYLVWNIVVVLIVAQMAVSGLTYNALSLFLPIWSRDLGAAFAASLLIGETAALADAQASS